MRPDRHSMPWTGVVLTAALSAMAPGPGSGTHVENFEKATVGAIPPGYSAAVGTWAVVDLPEGGKAFAQTGKSPDAVFNIAFEANTRIRNVDMSVRLRAVSGVDDQGGGLVWRARDAKNYYIARFNPLEENFRVYKVVDGKRTQIQTADAKKTEGWRTLRVWMYQNQIRCELDGRLLLEVEDDTFKEMGMIGFWSKADAQTQFDDFTRTAFE